VKRYRGFKSPPLRQNLKDMFDFEKLDIYQVVRELNQKVFVFLNNHTEIDEFIRLQWKKASQNSVLNLAESTGRVTNTDKKQYITIARGSVFESVAILQQVFDLNLITPEEYQQFYDKYEQASKMLLGMYRSYN
jgi:four helix bundle protein